MKISDRCTSQPTLRIKNYKPYIIGKIISGKNKIKLNENIKW